MARVKRGVTTKRKHKKILKMAKGYRSVRRTNFRRAKEAVMKAGQHAYVGRKVKKRQFRGLWIVRINAGLRANGTTYSKFVAAAKEKNILLNRKMLAELAMNEPKSFEAVVKAAK